MPDRDKFLRTVVLYRASSIISDAETTAGEIDVTDTKNLTFYLKYTKGTETGLTVTIKAKHTTGSDDKYQLGQYSNNEGSITVEQHTYLYTVTMNVPPIELDVTNLSIIEIYESKTGGTASGTLEIKYAPSNDE